MAAELVIEEGEVDEEIAMEGVGEEGVETVKGEVGGIVVEEDTVVGEIVGDIAVEVNLGASPEEVVDPE